MRNQFVKSTLLVGISTVIIMFTGCSAMNTAITHRNLQVQTKMSASVFLDPVVPSKKIVFVQIRNTTGKNLGHLKTSIDQILRNKGYTITQNPTKAEFMLQANVLAISKTTQKNANSIMNSAYGDAISGAIVGGSIGAMSSNYNSSTTAGVALAGAAIGFLANALVKDVDYVMVTDVQVKERAQNGETVTQTQNANMKNGTTSSIKQQISGAKTNWITYRTRIISSADKVNLKFKKAQPKLMSGLDRSIAGIF